jgi:hypothetical protein
LGAHGEELAAVPGAGGEEGRSRAWEFGGWHERRSFSPRSLTGG